MHPWSDRNSHGVDLITEVRTAGRRKMKFGGRAGVQGTPNVEGVDVVTCSGHVADCPATTGGLICRAHVAIV